MINNDYIDFEKFRTASQIKNQACLKAFLKELFLDLVEDKQKKSLSKSSFLNFMDLPLLISEKLFQALKKEIDSQMLTETDFVDGLFLLYAGTLEDTQKLIFNLLDFNNSGQIHRKNACLTLKFVIGVDNNNDVEELLNAFFLNRSLLNYKEFCYTVENINSDVFFYILYYFNSKRSFNDNTLNIYMCDSKRFQVSNTINGSSQNIRRKLTKSILTSPTKNINKCGIVFDITLLKLDDEEQEDIELAELSTPSLSYDITMISFNVKTINMLDSQCQNNIDNVKNNLKDAYWDDEGIGLGRVGYESLKIERKYLLDLNKLNTSNSQDIDHEGYIYKIEPEVDGGFNKKKFWLVLNEKIIFYFDSRQKLKLKGFHTLKGSFVNDEVNDITVNDKKYFSFEVKSGGKVRKYLCRSKTEATKWINGMRTVCNFRKFEDFYLIKEELGEGNFGKVYLGKNKQTNEEVAVKVLNKLTGSEKQVSEADIIRTEIEILKFSKHRNIVKYIDHFEDHRNIYLIEEFLCMNLETYLVSKNGAIHENKVRNIMQQIGEGVEYLHNNGVVHGDIKPQNILLSEETGKMYYKIIDFGLSKILGEGEYYYKGLGTLLFIAPEVYLNIGFNHKADIWSLGVLLHYLLFGNLPFDCSNEDDTEIAYTIVNEEYIIPDYKYISKEAKDLVTKCLVKDQRLRIGIKDFLEHKWFKL
jgi:hypothetical protein